MLLEKDVLPDAHTVELSDLSESGRLLGGSEDGENRGGSLAVSVGEVAVDVREEGDVREEDGEVAESLVLLLDRLLSCEVGGGKSALARRSTKLAKLTRRKEESKPRLLRELLPEPLGLSEVRASLLDNGDGRLGGLDLAHDAKDGRDGAEAGGGGGVDGHAREGEELEEDGCGVELDEVLAVLNVLEEAFEEL